MRMSKAKPVSRNMFINILKGALIASAVSVVLIVIYAFLLYKGVLSNDSVSIVNSFIKVVSAAVAAIIVVRKCQEKRWLFGGLTGLVYTLFAFMVFSILSSTFAFSWAMLSDMGMGVLTGIFTAMILSALGK